MEDYTTYLILAAGLFSMAGGLFNWSFFIHSRKARIWVKFLGERGARIFYVVLGAGIVTVGALLATGVIDPGNGS